MKTLGERLKYARECKGVTQTQVSKVLGINNKTLSGYERNVSEPDIDTLKKLAEYYDVDFNFLAGDTSNSKRSNEYSYAAKFRDDLLQRFMQEGIINEDMDDKDIENLTDIVIKILKMRKSN